MHSSGLNFYQVNNKTIFRNNIPLVKAGQGALNTKIQSTLNQG
jgi:hypothetical protein